LVESTGLLSATVPVVTFGAPTPIISNCGPPLPCNEIKILSNNKFSFLDLSFCGEILIRGNSVFDGYTKDLSAQLGENFYS